MERERGGRERKRSERRDRRGEEQRKKKEIDGGFFLSTLFRLLPSLSRRVKSAKEAANATGGSSDSTSIAFLSEKAMEERRKSRETREGLYFPFNRSRRCCRLFIDLEREKKERGAAFPLLQASPRPPVVAAIWAMGSK